MRAGDTIAACATPTGSGALAIVRVSGPRAIHAAGALSGLGPAALEPYRLRRARLLDGRGDVLDDAMVVVFAAPRSATGEDSAEFHLHGGPAVVAGVLAALRDLGCRDAAPGEFSRRAVVNGKMSLGAVEAAADLCAAQTALQRRVAAQALAGVTGGGLSALRERLVTAMALLEAAIDFADDDVPDGVLEQVKRDVAALRDELWSAVDLGRRQRRLVNGFEIVVAGEPNVGKSSLVNAIAGRHVALVSESAGTTRDAIEVGVDIRGAPCVFVDVAGLRATSEDIEAAGVALAQARIASADVVLSLRTHDIPEVQVEASGTVIPVWTKADRGSPPAWFTGLAVSSHTGDGVEALLERVVDVIGAPQMAAPATWMSARQVEDYARAVERLSIQQTVEPEIMAERLRDAARLMDAALGAVTTEQLLDSVFSRFCIGK